MTSIFKSSHLIAETWILRERTDGRDPTVHAIEQGVTTVGRHRNATVSIQHDTVSGQHAQFAVERGQLTVTDLSSTNGTYVNGHRIRQTHVLKPGDTIQFGKLVFDLQCDTVSTSVDVHQTVVEEVFSLAVAEKARRAVPQLKSSDQLHAWFQPIVRMTDCSIVGYEVLARGAMSNLNSAGQIFEAAESQGIASDISERVRYLGANIASGMGAGLTYFLNTHPDEFANDRLLKSLAELRDSFPLLSLVIEIHEKAVTDQRQLRRLVDGIRDLDCQYAYDDFGVGSSRILEILEFPPDYVKFDIEFVRRVANEDIPSEKAVSLIEVLRDLDVRLLAEGVETEQQHLRCQDLGFEFGQGYFYDRPMPPERAFRGS